MIHESYFKTSVRWLGPSRALTYLHVLYVLSLTTLCAMYLWCESPVCVHLMTIVSFISYVELLHIFDSLQDNCTQICKQQQCNCGWANSTPGKFWAACLANPMTYDWIECFRFCDEIFLIYYILYLLLEHTQKRKEGKELRELFNKIQIW